MEGVLTNPSFQFLHDGSFPSVGPIYTNGPHAVNKSKTTSPTHLAADGFYQRLWKARGPDSDQSNSYASLISL